MLCSVLYKDGITGAERIEGKGRGHLLLANERKLPQQKVRSGKQETRLLNGLDAATGEP